MEKKVKHMHSKLTFRTKADGQPYNEQYEERIRKTQTKQLFLKQKAILDKFLERGAITRAQYDESLRGMREKMGMAEEMR